MRYAPPIAMRVSDRGGGLNQTSVRTLNERLVMSLLRQHDQLSRMELVQLSGLSAQTVSVIVRALERDKMILPGEAQRGRVGPPSIPMSLNPDGAYAIGIRIGTKGTDLALVDFVGRVRHQTIIEYDAPRSGDVMVRLESVLPELVEQLPVSKRDRLVGIGLALPDDIDRWPLADWNLGEDDGWQVIDFEERVATIVDLPVHIQNDVTAAAGAEVIFGAARTLTDFAYFYVGATAASRLVLNHRIYAGRLPGRESALDVASLAALERAIAKAGGNPAPVWGAAESWPDLGPELDTWIEHAARGLADAIADLSAFVSFETTIIGGRLPNDVLNRVCDGVETALGEHFGAADAPGIVAGDSGALAKAIGSGGLPFHSRFMVEEVGLAQG